MKKLEGKTALVTGASRGIGRGLADAFAAEGASLIITARSSGLLDQLASLLRERGTEVMAFTADVTDEQDIDRLFSKAMERFPRLDILVNNAGVFDGGPLDELSLETWDRVMAVNLRGPFLCTRQAMKIMKQQRGGRIINIGSISAQRVRPFSAPYSTSKHGLWGLTQVTALEGREFGISCGCLHPGNTDVETLTEDRRRLREPVMKVEDCAQAAVAMASLPPEVNMLEAIVLPVDQLYIGRG
jgi:NAD(P)-dependent dehydrogenase (short-subunit alcohol dehydrogenase family)